MVMFILFEIWWCPIPYGWNMVISQIILSIYVPIVSHPAIGVPPFFLGTRIPTDELIFFREVAQRPTRDILRLKSSIGDSTEFHLPRWGVSESAVSKFSIRTSAWIILKCVDSWIYKNRMFIRPGLWKLNSHALGVLDRHLGIGKHDLRLWWTKCQLVNLHNYGKSPCSLGISTISGHFQYQILSLPEGTMETLPCHILHPYPHGQCHSVSLWYRNTSFWFVLYFAERFC